MSIYDEDDYKNYLKKVLGRGTRSQLAKFLSCQTGFISQVVGGPVHFSLEHSLLITRFLKLTQDEAEYFMLLVGQAKAGSVALEDHYQKKITEIKEKRKQIKDRIKVKEGLSKDEKTTYYSHWYYAAIHIAVMVESLRSKEALAQRFNLPVEVVQNVLDFLTQNHLVSLKEGEYRIGNSRIHIDKRSNLISRHHANWRLQALQALDRSRDENLHYSSVITLSLKDAEKVKEQMIKSLEVIEGILAPSPEEEVFTLNMDFFRL